MKIMILKSLICLLILPVIFSIISDQVESIVGYPLPKRNWKKGLYGTGKLLCFVHTAFPSHLTLAKTVYETWARKCDDVMFFTDSPMDWKVPHIYFPDFTTRDHSWEKIRHVMRFLYNTTMDQYDWYLRADDDAFVFVENARKFISRFDPNHAYLFGYRWNFFVADGYADGGTYLLSRKTLESFANITNNQDLCPSFHRAEEDQELSSCLAKIDILPSDSRDSSGRDRFHQFHAEERMLYLYNRLMRECGFYRYINYPQNISPTTIGMHHLSPYEMRFMDFLVNKVKITNQ